LINLPKRSHGLLHQLLSALPDSFEISIIYCSQIPTKLAVLYFYFYLDVVNAYIWRKQNKRKELKARKRAADGKKLPLTSLSIPSAAAAKPNKKKESQVAYRTT